MFTKDENNQEEISLEEVKDKIEYKDKYKPLKEDPNFIKMKEKQEKAENALKQWKKQKIESHKKHTSKKVLGKNIDISNEGGASKSKNSKGAKGNVLIQTGKAIIFQ